MFKLIAVSNRKVVSEISGFDTIEEAMEYARTNWKYSECEIFVNVQPLTMNKDAKIPEKIWALSSECDPSVWE